MLVWPPGDTTVKNFEIQAVDDDVPEPRKAAMFTIAVHDQNGQDVAAHCFYPTMLFVAFDDNDIPKLSISAPSTVSETAGAVTVVVTPNYAGVEPFGVNFSTAYGTANAGVDFVPNDGVLSWLANDATARTFTVPIIPHPGADPDRAFSVWLTTPSNSSIATAQATITIVDDPTLNRPGRRRAVRK